MGWPQRAGDEYEELHDTADDAQYAFRIAVLHPVSFHDARAIGEHFRDDIPVIVDLTGLSAVEAKRVVDFAAGLTFSLRGRIDRIASRVFLLAPAHFTIAS